MDPVDYVVILISLVINFLFLLIALKVLLEVSKYLINRCLRFVRRTIFYVNNTRVVRCTKPVFEVCFLLQVFVKFEDRVQN